MDNYILFIIPSNGNESVVQNILTSLRSRFDERKKFVNIFGESDNCQLVATDVKVAILLNTAFQSWKDLIAIDCGNDKLENREYTVFSAQSAAENLHLLADQLPLTGSYQVNVIWFWDHKIELNLSTSELLYGSCKRFASWHNAYFYFINETEERQELQQWIDLLPGELASSDFILNTFSPWNVFWTGGISLKSKENEWTSNLPGFEIVQHVDDDGFPNYFEDISDVPVVKTFFCSNPNAEIVAECNLETVPSFVLSNYKMMLRVKSSWASAANSTSWLKNFNVDAENEVGLILRLQYTTNELCSSRLSDFDPTTKNWRQMICKGQNKFSVPYLLNTKQLTFLMVADSENSSFCNLYLLRNSHSLMRIITDGSMELDEDVYLRTNLSPANDLIEICFESLPHINNEWISSVCSITQEVQMNVINFWKRKLDEGEELPEINSRNLKIVLLRAQRKCLESLYEAVFEKMNLSLDENKDEIPCFARSELSVDPNDWPERNALLHYELEAVGRNTGFGPQALSGLFSSKNITYDCKEMTRHFGENGEAKTNFKLTNFNKNIESLCPLPPTISREELLSLGWPDAKDLQYPDIHYNKGVSSEADEKKRNEFKDQALRNETASTFSATSVESELQVKTTADSPKSNTEPLDFQVTLRRSPRLKKSSVSSSVQQLENLRRQSVQIRKLKEKEKSRGRLELMEIKTVAKKITRDGTLARLNSVEIGSKSSDLRKSNRDDELRPTEKRVIVKETSVFNLTDRQKKKLRAAVFDALEEQGITCEHPLFQVCGGKLFSICRTFVKDMIVGHGTTSEKMKRIADSHVRQVIEFEKQLDAFRKKSSPLKL